MKAATVRIARSVVGERTDELAEKSTKIHASRRISVDRETLSSLEAQHRRNEERARAVGNKLPAKAHVFSDSPDGSVPCRPNRVTHAFIHLCNDVGVAGVRLHDLRHFATTRLLAAGVPVNTLAGRFGHANAATTQNVYGHFLESSDESAAQVLGSLLDGPKRSAKAKASPNRR